MNDLKAVIAKNLIELRRTNRLTQVELAEKLNYSDKAVSKWERAESIPDVGVLKAIAELFNVTVDYLLCESHEAEILRERQFSARQKRNRTFIVLISVLLVWFVAIFAFVNIEMFADVHGQWLTFLYAVPISCIVWLVFNNIWFNKRKNFIIISILMWSSLAVIFFTALVLGFNLWLLFLTAIPCQIIIILWSGIKIKKK